MDRRGKPKKAKEEAKRPLARKSPEDPVSKVNDLEKRLAEVLEREAEALELKAEALGRETETLEQQSATGAILRMISTSPTDVQPVFDAVVKSAARFCAAEDAQILRLEGDGLRLVAHHGPISAMLESVISIGGTAAGRAVLERRAVHVADMQAETEQFPEGSAIAREMGWHTGLSVPLLREGVPLGVILLRRTEVAPFSGKQIALLQTFADQAVIAIENVRLFTELGGRNRELTEALERQTATSDVLRIISGSPTDIQPVFRAILERATRLCGAEMGRFWWRDDDGMFRLVESLGSSPEHIAWLGSRRHRFGRPFFRETGPWEAGQIEDVRDTEPYRHGDEVWVRSVDNEGFRTLLNVPLVQEGRFLGCLSIYRREVRRFTGPQVSLVKTFADQAVIAVENVRLFKELEAANRGLAAASQHKSEFLANMSHELRTPLNAIIGFSEVLNERMFGELNEKQEEYLQDIHASGQHLLSLINDILDLSKIEAGRMELELTDFHLPTAINDALILVRERAGRRGIRLGSTLDESVGTILADERKVKQVLLNLLSNALKFTPEGGRIDVRAAMNEGMAEISVTDTGVGIAPEDQQAVFEEFRQVGRSDKKAEGTGLGLTLCRKFIELHGGRIWVKSEVGQGSTFTFTIPVRPSELQA